MKTKIWLLGCFFALTPLIQTPNAHAQWGYDRYQPQYQQQWYNERMERNYWRERRRMREEWHERQAWREREAAKQRAWENWQAQRMMPFWAPPPPPFPYTSRY